MVELTIIGYFMLILFSKIIFALRIEESTQRNSNEIYTKNLLRLKGKLIEDLGRILNENYGKKLVRFDDGNFRVHIESDDDIFRNLPYMEGYQDYFRPEDFKHDSSERIYKRHRKRSIEPATRYLSTSPEITGTQYPLEQVKDIPRTGKQRERHQSVPQPSIENIVYESVISALTNPTAAITEYPTQKNTHSEDNTKNHDDRTVLFSTIMDMNTKNHSFFYTPTQTGETDLTTKNIPENDIAQLTEMIPNFNKIAVKLNATMTQTDSKDMHELNRKILMENLGANGQNNTKATNKKLNKLAMLLSKISWDILERHDDIKNMHKELIHTYFDFLKKKSEINKNITDFINKQSELVDQKQHIIKLEDMLVGKQNKFEERQNEFRMKEKEFENIQKKFLMRQHDFAKNQVYLTNKSEKIMKQQNEISHKQADIGASQATLSKLFKNTYKSPNHSSFNKLRKDTETNYYDTMMKEIHDDYIDVTTEKTFKLPKSFGRQGSSKKLENNKKQIEENIKNKNAKKKALSQKTIHYLETYDIDDLVYQRYFKNTSFDRIFRKTPLKKQTRSHRDVTFATPSIESLLENIILTNKEENNQNNTDKSVNHSDLIEYMDMFTTERSDSTNILDNIYDYLSKHVGKSRSKRNVKTYKDHRKHHKKAIRNLERNIRKITFHHSKLDSVNFNTTMEKFNDSRSLLRDSNITTEQMITNAKRFCNEIDQNSNEITFNYCVEKALRRLQHSESRPNKTEGMNEMKKNRQFNFITTPVEHNSTDHRMVANSIQSGLDANKIVGAAADYNGNDIHDDGFQMNTEGTVYWDGSFYSKDAELDEGVSDKLPGDTSDSEDKRNGPNSYFRSQKKNYRKSGKKEAWWKLKRRH